MDSLKIKRALITLSLVFAAVFIASYGIRANKVEVYWAVVLFPVAVFFVKDPRSIFIFAVLAQMAWLRTPGHISTVVTPFNLAAGALFISSLALVAMKRITSPKLTQVEGWLLGFTLVVFVTMAVRGGGFALLGGESWGGGKYISMILLFCFYFAMRRFEYNRSHVRWLIWGGLFATLALAFAQFLFHYTGGRTFGLTNFMQIQAESAAGGEMLGNEAAITRFTHFRWLAYALLPLSFFWPQRKFLSFSIVGVSVALMLMTGFRAEAVSLGMVYIFCGWALAKRKGTFLFFLGAVGVLGYIALFLLVDVLPEAAVRSVSFLPGIEAGGVVAASTEHSTDWRFEVWRYCLKEAPDYLLVGRGLAFDVREWAWLQASVYTSPEFFYGTHAYHNGPLSLLLDFGVFGLLTMTGFFISSSAYVVRCLKQIAERGTIYYKFAVYLTAVYIWMVIKFYLIYGDVTYYLTRMMIVYVMILATLNYLKQAASVSKENESTAG